jgi:hypothetical protein
MEWNATQTHTPLYIRTGITEQNGAECNAMEWKGKHTTHTDSP